MKTTQQIILISILAFTTLAASHKGIDRLELPLPAGESRTYRIVQALESRDVGEGATLTLESNRVTVTQGDCSFGGEFVGDSERLEFAFSEGSFNKSMSICSGALGDVQLMIQDLFDTSRGYIWRSLVFNSEWLVLGWNSATEGKVDLLVGQKVIPNEHALKPEA